MVVEYVRFQVPLDTQAGFLEAYQQACDVLANSPYCLAYELSHCQEEPEIGLGAEYAVFRRACPNGTTTARLPLISQSFVQALRRTFPGGSND